MAAATEVEETAAEMAAAMAAAATAVGMEEGKVEVLEVATVAAAMAVA